MKRSLLPLSLLAAGLGMASLAAADSPFAPPPSGSRAGVPTVKQQGTKPLTGTRATGDEDETNDLEVQRRTRSRTFDGGGGGAIKSGAKLQLAPGEPPRGGGDTAYRDPGRFSQGRPTGSPVGPMTDPNAPVQSGNNAIPVHK